MTVGGKAASVAALAALAIAAAVNTWAKLAVHDDPARVLGVIPDYSTALLHEIELRFVESDGVASPEILDFGRRLLRRQPLSDAPLVFVGLAHARLGRDGEAWRSMTEAQRRNPRGRAARLWLAQHAIEEADFAAALDQLGQLIAIDGANRDVYLETMVAIAADARSHDELVAQLEQTPNWGRFLIQKLNERSEDLELLLRVNKFVPERQGQFLMRLARSSDYYRAYLAWLEYLPPLEPGELRWPFNGEFKHEGVSPPFNWAVHSGQAEISADRGLHATFLGRGQTVFADQLMLLAPGAYRFEALMEVETRDGGGVFAWRIACADDAAELGETKVAGVRPVAAAFGFDFEVPAGACGVQRLELRGEAGEYPLWARSRTASVRIDDKDGRPVE
ncbi:MAG: hypothetical protein MI723_10685 [Caulobacterales bacterium]|nr:hypothetical protein [Caulobacterales bacterium]